MPDDGGTFVYTVYHPIVGLFYFNWLLHYCQNAAHVRLHFMSGC